MPQCGLDPTAKREVEALLAELAAQGMTLLMASHQLGEVKRFAQRVVYLERGRVLADALVGVAAGCMVLALAMAVRRLRGGAAH